MSFRFLTYFSKRLFFCDIPASFVCSYLSTGRQPALRAPWLCQERLPGRHEATYFRNSPGFFNIPASFVPFSNIPGGEWAPGRAHRRGGEHAGPVQFTLVFGRKGPCDPAGPLPHHSLTEMVTVQGIARLAAGKADVRFGDLRRDIGGSYGRGASLSICLSAFSFQPSALRQLTTDNPRTACLSQTSMNTRWKWDGGYK
jgi:hypothetical protein